MWPGIVVFIIKFLLILALTFGVYTETGAWTAIAIFLLLLVVELSYYSIKDAKDMARKCAEALSKMDKL